MRRRDVTLSPNPTPEEPSCQTFVNNSPITPETHTLRSNNLVGYFKFKKGRDSPGETRNALLVIAVLVATATFQVRVNPPGGVWQDNYIPERSNSSSSYKGHKQGLLYGFHGRNCIWPIHVFQLSWVYIVSNFHCSLSSKYAWSQCSPHMA